MADRDVEREKLIKLDKLKEMLMAEWNSKTKKEKQEFISKFIENVTIEKHKKGYYNLVNINFRNSFLEELYKFMDKWMFQVEIPCTKGKEETRITSSIAMDRKELKEYMQRLNDYYEVSYYEMARLDESQKGYQKKNYTIDLVNDDGEKLFKLVEIICDDKAFPIQKANRIVGEIRIKEREKFS